MNQPRAHLPIRAAAISDVGRVRKNNEDNFLISLENKLFIVSDGMGGERAGEVASKAVITILPLLIGQHLAGSNTKGKEEVLKKAILTLSQSLYTQSAEISDLKGTGATVVVAWIQENIAYLAHMGDSRIYLFREGNLTRLTEDHSVVGLLIHQGEITSQDAKTHPARGYLSRYIGMKDSMPPTTQVLNLRNGDRLLLCSDGLSGEVSDKLIARIMGTHVPPQETCYALVKAANDAGGKDNVTVLVVEYEKTDDR